MSKFKVFISGQKYFAEQVFILCHKMGMEIVGVCCPIDDKYIGRAAKLWNVPIIPAGMLNADNMPACDLGVTAHSFDYIGKKNKVYSTTWLAWLSSITTSTPQR